MPKVGNINVSILREESATTGNLIEALCNAYPEFPPIPLDSTGRRDGEEYRYASISSIRRAVMPALARHGVWLHHVYGESAEGSYAVTMLRHKSGEYISSTLRIPPNADAQAAKATMTLWCRTMIEGLLSIASEEDTDAQGTGPAAVDIETQKRWANNLALAEAAVMKAADQKQLDRYLQLAGERAASGDMPPNAVDVIKRLCDVRSTELSPKEVSSDDGAGNASTEGADAAGSGDGGEDRPRGRRAAGTGRSAVPVGDRSAVGAS